MSACVIQLSNGSAMLPCNERRIKAFCGKKIATCADWELAGGWTTVNGQRVKDEGLLEPFEVSLEEAQTMVMTARVMLGWVDPDELVAASANTAEGETAEEAGA